MQCLVSIADESALSSQAVTVFARSSKKYVSGGILMGDYAFSFE